jgi:hypothetical protein
MNPAWPSLLAARVRGWLHPRAADAASGQDRPG